jgi:hypothetical protein
VDIEPSIARLHARSAKTTDGVEVFQVMRCVLKDLGYIFRGEKYLDRTAIDPMWSLVITHLY